MADIEQKMQPNSHISLKVLLVVVFFLQYTSGTSTTLSPTYTDVAEGTDSIVFTCMSRLSTLEAIQEHWMVWKKNNVTIVENSTVLDEAKYSVQGPSYIQSVTVTQTLTIHNIEMTDIGVFSCTLQSTSGHVVLSSSYVELTVSEINKEPTRSTTVSPKYVAVDEGTDSIVFMCFSNLSPIDAILTHWMVWKIDNVVIVENSTVLNAVKYSVQGASYISSITVIQNLTVHNIEKTDSGIFSCTLQSTSSYFITSSSHAELRVIRETTEMSDFIQTNDDTKISIYLTTGGIMFIVVFLGSILIMCKISRYKSSSVNNNDCSDEDQEKDRRMSYYENIDAKIEREMTEKTTPLPEINDLNYKVDNVPTTL